MYLKKNVISLTECINCKEIFLGDKQALDNRVSLHKSNMRIPENTTPDKNDGLSKFTRCSLQFYC